MRATCPTHLTLTEVITRVMLGEEYVTGCSQLYNLLHSPGTSYNEASAVYSHTSSVCVPQCEWDTKFHTHIKAGKIIVVYTIILIFLYSKL
jgi:hypothetical protein